MAEISRQSQETQPQAATAIVEHVNITVTNPEATAHLLCELFDWQVRWQGPSSLGGRTVHVGTPESYLAVYSPDVAGSTRVARKGGGLNHIGIQVEDLDAVEQRILSAGFTTFSHGDYEPGKRFYFNDADGIEYEVVSYNP